MDKIWSADTNFVKVMLSSTYRFQKPSSAVSKETNDLSEWTIYIPANTGSNRESIATPCKM